MLFPVYIYISKADWHEILYALWRKELEKCNEKFDIIVGDLADPVEGGPCYQLYTKSFYEKILKPRLNDKGIFVTQVGFFFLNIYYYYIFVMLLLYGFSLCLHNYMHAYTYIYVCVL